LAVLIQPKKGGRTWALAGLGLLGLSFAINVLAPSLSGDRYVGLVAWPILAISGGRTLRSLTRSSRQLQLAVPLIFLVCLSAIVNPTFSPQFGFAPNSLLPTTESDRWALEWADGHANVNLASDTYSAAYLRYIRTQSYVAGHGHGWVVSLYPNFDPSPRRDSVVVVRWSNVNNQSYSGGCSRLTSALADETANLIYNNSCDMLVGSP